MSSSAKRWCLLQTTCAWHSDTCHYVASSKWIRAVFCQTPWEKQFPSINRYQFARVIQLVNGSDPDPGETLSACWYTGRFQWLALICNAGEERAVPVLGHDRVHSIHGIHRAGSGPAPNEIHSNSSSKGHSGSYSKCIRMSLGPVKCQYSNQHASDVATQDSNGDVMSTVPSLRALSKISFPDSSPCVSLWFRSK